MKNVEIRNTLKNASIRHWQLAEAMGISENTLVRRLRKELSVEEKLSVITIIQELAQNRREVG